ncbi:hypothetical protein IAU59_000906 [Kwoniella sp. CBS 9459]
MFADTDTSPAGVGQYSTSPARPIDTHDLALATSSSTSVSMPGHDAGGTQTLDPLRVLPSAQQTQGQPQPYAPAHATTAPEPSLQALLGQTLTLDLIDGRQFIGFLLCVDRDQNIILRDAEESKPLSYPLSPTTGQPLIRVDDEEGKTKWDAIRENREMYWPHSEPFGGWESGWGGRCMGMVGVKGADVVKIGIERAVWKGIGGQVTIDHEAGDGTGNEGGNGQKGLELGSAEGTGRDVETVGQDEKEAAAA